MRVDSKNVTKKKQKQKKTCVVFGGKNSASNVKVFQFSRLLTFPFQFASLGSQKWEKAALILCTTEQ